MKTSHLIRLLALPFISPKDYRRLVSASEGLQLPLADWVGLAVSSCPVSTQALQICRAEKELRNGRAREAILPPAGEPQADSDLT